MLIKSKNYFFEDITNEVIGIDEVGRGSLCGPVVSCSILLSKKIFKHDLICEINDSKKINEKKRKIIATFIKKNSLYSIGKASNREIDKINILQATNLSMMRSYERFRGTNNLVKIDGLQTFHLNERTTFIKKGDQKSVSIAAASIIAKTWRDQLMESYSKIYPLYGWEKNKGYGTKEHIEAIKKHGLTDIHRRSFLKNL
ncbi:MAG: ribonuclease HII [Pseudomonadota bacterium]|nr:ribonuclease HII [Pseudomonadota bacterium]